MTIGFCLVVVDLVTALLFLFFAAVDTFEAALGAIAYAAAAAAEDRAGGEAATFFLPALSAISN